MAPPTSHPASTLKPASRKQKETINTHKVPHPQKNGHPARPPPSLYLFNTLFEKSIFCPKNPFSWCIMDFWHEKPGTNYRLGWVEFYRYGKNVLSKSTLDKIGLLTQCDVQNTRERAMMRWKMGNSVDF